MTKGGASNLSTIISLAVATFGTGILLMPSSFHILGVVVAFISASIAAFCMFFSLYSLSYAATATGKIGHPYAALSEFFSRKLGVLVGITLVAGNFGTVVFILGKFCESLIDFAKSQAEGYGYSVPEVALRPIILVLLLSGAFVFFIKDSLASLSFLSKISFSCVVYYLALTIFFAFKYGLPLKQLVKPENANFSKGFIRFVFGLHCQFSYPDIFGLMENTSMGNVTGVLAAGALVVGSIYAASGFFGYKAVGGSIEGCELILELYTKKDSTFILGIPESSRSYVLFLSYLCLFGFLAVWFGTICFCSFSVISTVQSWLSQGGKKVPRSYIALPMAVLLFVLGLSKVGGGVVLEVISAVCTNPLSFVYPSVFLLYAMPGMDIRKIVAVSLILFSGFLMTSMLYNTYKNFKTASS